MRSTQKTFNIENHFTSTLSKLVIYGLVLQGMLASFTSATNQKSFALRRVASTPSNQAENMHHVGAVIGTNYWTRRLFSMMQTLAYGTLSQSKEVPSYTHRMMEGIYDDDGSFNGEVSDNFITPNGPTNNATKSSWPECLSLSCGTCHELIHYEEPSLSMIEIVSADTVILQEFRADRVLIVCNNEKVMMTPRIR
jgi:hypothetical protein